MRWWEVTVQVPVETAEAVSALLSDWVEVKGVSIEGVSVSEAPHPEYGEWLDESLLQNDIATVKVYVPEHVEQTVLEGRLNHLVLQVRDAGLALPEVQPWSLQQFDESAWENAWKDQFQPIPVGQSLLIVPKWELQNIPATGRLPIILEPGMAFGTGTHATTRLCLQALEQVLRKGTRVLDIGCGTAVLSIAAARLGAAFVKAIDIDPVAVQVARENVAENGVGDIVEVVEGDLLAQVQDGGYQVAMANILRDPVIALTPDAARKLAPGGHFILSGFIVSQEAAVLAALGRAGFEVIERLQEEDWLALAAVKLP